MTYVCSKCGGTDVEVSPGRPSLDDRYAVGYCDRCCPYPVIDPKDAHRTKPVNRATVPLVRADRWDPEAAAERDRLRRDKQLVEKAIAGKPMSEADYQRAQEVRRRWEAEARERKAAS